MKILANESPYSSKQCTFLCLVHTMALCYFNLLNCVVFQAQGTEQVRQIIQKYPHFGFFNSTYFCTQMSIVLTATNKVNLRSYYITCTVYCISLYQYHHGLWECPIILSSFIYKPGEVLSGLLSNIHTYGTCKPEQTP